MNLKLATALFIAAAFTGTAFCDTINFSTPTGTLGSSQVYNAGPNSVTAYAFGGSGLLFGKNDGGSEHGVGISGNPDNEITNTTFVQLDLANITGLYSLVIGSTQSVEGFNVCFSNTLGTLGGSCQDFTMPGSDPFTTSDFTKGDRYVSVQADGTPTTAGNVLLDGLNFTASSAVPEPSSLLLLGTGILGAAGMIRRRLS